MGRDDASGIGRIALPAMSTPLAAGELGEVSSPMGSADCRRQAQRREPRAEPSPREKR